MAETPEWLREKIKAYYKETTGPYYLSWAGDTLAFHVGLSDEPAPPATGEPADGVPPVAAARNVGDSVPPMAAARNVGDSVPPMAAARNVGDSVPPMAAARNVGDSVPPMAAARAPLTREETLVKMNEFLADKARVGPGARVLDAGCGVGGSSIWLARERAAAVTGITLDPGQVEMARQFAAERGVTGVTFEQMDFSATTFEQPSFDVVWNIESLCHSSDARNYLRHVFDLLEDGGRFACMDFFRGSGGNPADCDAMCEGWVLPDFQLMEAVATMLSDIGFESVETEDVTARVLPSAEMLRSGGLWWSVIYKLEAAAGNARGPMGGKHFVAAVGAGDGLRTGSVKYGYVGATRPRRR